jgi:DNA mismatch endonuclease, patch repair protein
VTLALQRPLGIRLSWYGLRLAIDPPRIQWGTSRNRPEPLADGSRYCVPDTIDKAARSRLMARVRSKGTGLEMRVRRALHATGLRYRLHDKALPGTPDIVFRRHMVAVEVRGCFWHQHGDPACPGARLPKGRQDYWLPKLRRNAERDEKNEAELRGLGWKVVVIWECECRTEGGLRQAVERVIAVLRDRETDRSA